MSNFATIERTGIVIKIPLGEAQYIKEETYATLTSNTTRNINVDEYELLEGKIASSKLIPILTEIDAEFLSVRNVGVDTTVVIDFRNR